MEENRKAQEAMDELDLDREDVLAEDAPDAPDMPEEGDSLAQALRQRDEYMELLKRLQAEFDNFRKRNNAARSESYEEGARDTVALILPVLDNMERALSAAKEKDPLRDGVEMIYRQLLENLEKQRGVAVIDRAGEPFDPELENAVMQVGADRGEPGTVHEVLQKGYRMHSRVIRHAMVSVVEG